MNMNPRLAKTPGDIASSLRRTNVLRISFLRGLCEAKTIRFPKSFFMLGVWRACERIELCFEGILWVEDTRTSKKCSITKL